MLSLCVMNTEPPVCPDICWQRRAKQSSKAWSCGVVSRAQVTSCDDDEDDDDFDDGGDDGRGIYGDNHDMVLRAEQM